MVRWREPVAFGAVLAVFAVLEVAAFSETGGALRTAETRVYERAAVATDSPSLAVFTAAKGAVPLLIFGATGGDPISVLRVHQLLAVLCWGALALAVAGLFRRAVPRIAAVIGICAFALVLPVAGWNGLLQSESSANSLAAASIAAAVWCWRVAHGTGSRAGRKGASIAAVAICISMAFLAGGTRDTFSFSLATVAGVFVAGLWRPGRHRMPLAVAAAGLVGVVAFHAVAQRASSRWQAPLLNIVLYRVLPFDDVRGVWVDRYGMPARPEFLALARSTSFRRLPSGRSIKNTIFNPKSEVEAARFAAERAWLEERGHRSYAAWLLSRPVDASAEVGHQYLRHLGFRGDDILALRPAPWNRALSSGLYPAFDPVGFALLCVASVAVCGWAWRADRGERRVACGLVALLLANSWVQMFAAYHGDAHDVARHSLHYGIFLRLGFLVTALLAIALVEERWAGARLERSSDRASEPTAIG